MFDAGLWLSEAQIAAILEEKKRNDPEHKDYRTLSAIDYLKKRENPILVIYPIELETDCNKDEEKLWGNRINELRSIKQEIKALLCEDENTPLMAFGIGFPRKEKPVSVTYLANQIKLAELRSNIESDDDDESDDEEGDDNG